MLDSLYSVPNIYIYMIFFHPQFKYALTFCTRVISLKVGISDGQNGQCWTIPLPPANISCRSSQTSKHFNPISWGWIKDKIDKVKSYRTQRLRPPCWLDRNDETFDNILYLTVSIRAYYCTNVGSQQTRFFFNIEITWTSSFRLKWVKNKNKSVKGKYKTWLIEEF